MHYRRIALLICLITTASISAQEAKFEARFWKETPDQADVLAATFIGGKGNEWLTGGGFQPDGTIVLVGNVIGPVFDLPVPVGVIGKDNAPPAEPKPVPQMAGNKPRLDKAGNPLFEKTSWRHDGVTGFVIRTTPDLKKIISAHRLPWTAGAITSAAVAADGSIYIAGKAGDTIASIGGTVSEEQPAPEAIRKEGQCDHVFLAKLGKDGSKVEWVKHLKGKSDAPTVAVNADGSIRFGGQDARTYDTAGKLLKTVVIPGGVRKTASISPVDGSIVEGGEHHSPTGREPWRCPTLNMREPDGKLRHQLYDWGGPFVGLDNSRLVSDTAVRFVTHDAQGNILLYAWSDGGNSVMTRQPLDVREPVHHKGLGINAAGAGVLSCAYIVRIEPKTYKVIGWTIWLAFTGPNKPNSVWIDNMTQSANGSVLAVGRAAMGLWQSKNKLSDVAPTGDYVAIYNPDLSGVRFCSIVPGAGATEVSYDKAGWGIFTGKVDGKERALFLCGATKESKDGDRMVPTPTVNAGQSTFGGGTTDGYVLMLDLSKSAPPGDVAALEKPKPGPTIGSFERGAQASKGKVTLPENGTSYIFKPDVPKWITADAEFRDQNNVKWPSFLIGKPVEGTLTFKDGKLQGTFTVECNKAIQTAGDQSGKVLGAFYIDGATPTAKLSITSLGDMTKAEIPTTDAKGKQGVKVVEYCMAKGTLEIGGRKIDVTPKLTINYGKTTGIYKGPGNVSPSTESVRLSAYVTVKGSDLGLKTDDLIDLRIGMSGIAPPPGPLPGPKLMK